MTVMTLASWFPKSSTFCFSGVFSLICDEMLVWMSPIAVEVPVAVTIARAVPFTTVVPYTSIESASTSQTPMLESVQRRAC